MRKLITILSILLISCHGNIENKNDSIVKGIVGKWINISNKNYNDSKCSGWERANYPYVYEIKNISTRDSTGIIPDKYSISGYFKDAHITFNNLENGNETSFNGILIKDTLYLTGNIDELKFFQYYKEYDCLVYKFYYYHHASNQVSKMLCDSAIYRREGN